MLLYLSKLFLRTLRDDPVDAELPSHKLLARAGFTRRVGPGIYSWLPLGLMAVRNVERVVREEMLAIGAQEVLFPALVTMGSYGIGITRAIAALAEQAHDELGLRVLYDDRAWTSAGVKFGDAELLGAPLIVTVGRGLAHGSVEVRDRWSGERHDISLEGAAEEVARWSAAQR